MNERLRIVTRRILESLARILIREGVKLAPITEILRKAYVDAAIEEIQCEGGTVTASRISTMTGLSRKSVTSLRCQPPESTDLSLVYGIDYGDLITHWVSSSDFVDPVGKPRDLEVGPGNGTFSDLVERRLGRNDVEHILNTLQKADNVGFTQDGRVRLNKRAWVTVADAPLQLADTVVSGLHTTEKILRDRNLAKILCCRTVYTSNIDPTKVDPARQSIRRKIKQFTREVDDYLAAVGSETRKPLRNHEGHELQRVGVGIYYFEIEK